jgi:hypothetical protein
MRNGPWKVYRNWDTAAHLQSLLNDAKLGVRYAFGSGYWGEIDSGGCCWAAALVLDEEWELDADELAASF